MMMMLDGVVMMEEGEVFEDYPRATKKLHLGDMWCNGLQGCFPRLQPVLEWGFESWLGLEFSGFSMWHFLKLVIRGFLQVLRFPPSFFQLVVQPIR